MAEKTPSGFDIEQRAKSDGEEEKAGRRWRSDPTLPCFQIALNQKEEIAAFLQRFRKVPQPEAAAAAAGEEKDPEDAEDSF